jgi:hypothetical protein
VKRAYDYSNSVCRAGLDDKTKPVGPGSRIVFRLSARSSMLCEYSKSACGNVDGMDFERYNGRAMFGRESWSISASL